MNDLSSEDEFEDTMLGALVAGRYQVDALLGKGGMGRVYRAHQAGLRREVALKVLHTHTAMKPGMKERFQREARAASMLQHPHSVVVHDFGEWEDRLFIVMEILAGHDLSDVIKEGPLPAERIADILEQLLDVLEVAHNQGLLHRDLKPENVILLDDPRAETAADEEDGFRDYVKVVDFGLARLMDPESDMNLTQDDSISGTPAYMSPEQAKSADLDGRSDLYSVGVMLYEMLCGERPFTAPTPLAVLVKHLFIEPPRPSHRAPETAVHSGLEEVCLRAMSKQPDDRFATAGAMRAAIAQAMRDGNRFIQRPGIKKLSRAERAETLGISNISEKAVKATDAVAIHVLVVRAVNTDFSSSPVAVLKAFGVEVEEQASLADVAPIADHIEAVVVDLRPEPLEALAEVQHGLSSWGLAGRPVTVLGPDDSFDLMQQALSMGVGDYVPVSNVAKLAKTIRRAVRRYRRKAKG